MGVDSNVLYGITKIQITFYSPHEGYLTPKRRTEHTVYCVSSYGVKSVNYYYYPNEVKIGV